jgi:non-ribosomal peptide synthetase component F
MLKIELEADLTRQLKEFSQRHGATLYMTLLAGLAALLSRLSGQDEVVIGSPAANRTRAEIEPLIGLFVNTLALRIDLSGSPTAEELLKQVKARTLEAQQHQDLPFEQVVEIVQPPRSPAHAPIFQVMLAWQNTPEAELTLPELTLRPLATPQLTAKFDLSLLLRETEQGIAGSLEYATALFERETMERYLKHWRTLLRAMIADDGRAIEEFPLLTAGERRRALEEWNRTETADPGEKLIHQLFEEQVERSPESIALVDKEQSLTYRELNWRADLLAHHLRTFGVGPDARVAVCLERGVEMVIALMAVLKAGGAYVPLDPAYPSERLAYLLDDSAPEALIIHDATSELLCGQRSDISVLNLDRRTPRSAPPSSLDHVLDHGRATVERPT